MRRLSRDGLGKLAVGLMLVVILGACSSGGSNSPTSSRSSSLGGSDGAVAAATTASASAPSLDTGNSESVTTGGATSSQSTSAAPSATTDWDRKIIRNAAITLQVTNVESMLATVRSITDSASGLVFASSTSFDGDNQVATMTVDIPAAQFDQVVSALRSAPGVKKVQSESITSQDVTDQYVDYQSQLKSLTTTQDRLLALLNSATNMNDIITLNDHLSDIQNQIDQITGRINYIDQKTSFSRITLTINPVSVVLRKNNNGGFDLGKAVSSAWEASLRFTGGAVTNLVKAAVFLWWVVPIAALAYLLFALRRQRRRQGKPIAE